VQLGGTVSFTISVTNTGTNKAVSTQLVDQLTTIPGVTWSLGTVSWGIGSCSINASNQLTCGTGTNNPLQVGATFSVVVNGAVDPSNDAACGSYTNAAAFGYGDGIGRVSVPANGGTPVTFEIRCSPIRITVNKTPGTQSVRLGGTVSFTISVSNSTASTLPAVSTQLTDQLATIPGVTWSLGAISWGNETCAIDASNLLTCGTGTDNRLVPGATFSVVVNGATTAGVRAACGTYTNQAQFTYGDLLPRFVAKSPIVTYTITCPKD
jgi:uncharacterized repeat protein (TIGR01451 family)